MRWIAFLLFLVVSAVVAGSLTETPGTVLIEWRQYRISTSVVFALAASLLFVAAIVLLGKLLAAVLRLPGRIGQRREQRHHREGYAALRQALFALASGDGSTASRQAKRAEGLLGDPPLTTLIAAQAAQLSKDDESASRLYSSLRDQPAAEPSAIRGLLTEAIKRNDAEGARALAEQAHAKNPGDTWIAETLYDLRKRTGAWADAAALLPVRSEVSRLAPGGSATRERAELLYRQSLATSGSEALDWAKKAQEADPAFTPAVLRYARLLIDTGQSKRAAEAIEAAWRRNPAEELADAYAEAEGCGNPLERVQAMQRIAASNPDHVESHLAIAEAALHAGLWGEARRHLDVVIQRDPSPRAYRLMAAVEERETGDLAKARPWLELAAGAPPASA